MPADRPAALILACASERSTDLELQATAETSGARVWSVTEASALPGELRRLGPDVLVLPAGAGPVERLVELVAADVPRCRVVVLAGAEAVAAVAAIEGVFAIVPGPPVEPGILRRVLGRALEAFTPEGTVLVVEDSAVNLELIADVLQANGYRVLRATAAEEALELAQIAVPDLVLMDVYLPAMNGIEATRRLKASAATAPVPVLMLSADGTDAAIAEALAAGAADYLLKPFSPRRLLERVAQLVARRRLLAVV